jgi:hypothetical protein
MKCFGKNEKNNCITPPILPKGTLMPNTINMSRKMIKSQIIKTTKSYKSSITSSKPYHPYPPNTKLLGSNNK